MSGARPAPSELLALAVDAAREAGDLLLAGRRGEVEVADTKSSPTDVVTAMDRASEELLRDRLLGARPGDTLLGEEGGEQDGGGPESSGVRWVVDPLDGTVNYLYDLPAWAVSVAVQVDGTTVAGVVHLPRLGETYTATRGGGAWLGERRLTVTPDVPLERALVGTGFGYGADRRAVQARVLADVLPRVRDIRRMGAAAVDLCLLAAGRLDAYFERGLKPWDAAAGGLVAAEAGALVTGLSSDEPSEAYLVAGHPGLQRQLRELLSGLDAEHD